MGRSAINAAIILIAMLWLPRSVHAQELDSAEYRERVWFVPRLVGALSLDAAIQTPFHLSGESGYPTTWGFTAGWRHYFDGHGRVSLRPFAAFERGGLLQPQFEGTSTRIGGGVALTFRGITQDWVIGTASVVADGSALWFEPPSTTFSNPSGAALAGSQFGFGFESTFGALIVGDPYVFTETGASVTLSRVTIDGVEAWEAWARWKLRFEWAIPRVRE